jgi:D-alanyl-D-alanine carboxypeptidase
MMTAKARALGMQSTTFRNASGLPDEGQRTTAHDMAILGMALRRHFPHHYHYFSNREFTYAGKVIRGHNNLLGKVVGADGLKTGYIRASGFNLVTSVGRGGRRIVAVVMGGETAKSRDAHMEELIELYLPKATPAGV